MDRVLVMILAGGAPDALDVLCRHRAKTAVPFGGRYRLIDFPLSNCVNSGLRNIYILTQYNPRSLRRHIRLGRPWDLDRSQGGVRVLLPYSGAHRRSWFRGTADALSQNLDVILRNASPYVLILSGDHIYKMDYRELFHRHVVTGAALTLATRPTKPGDGARFGMVATDPAGMVAAFREKPGDDGYSDTSLGIYLFQKEFLVAALEEMARADRVDLVSDLIIPSVGRQRIAAYRYGGYWEDVGDLHAFYRANLMLVHDDPPLRLDDPGWPIHTRIETFNPSWFAPGARVERSLISAGCRIEGEVRGSVLFPNVVVEEGACVDNAVIFSHCRIEAGARVHQAVLDKRVQVGARSVLSGDDGLVILGKRETVRPGSRLLGAASVGRSETRA